MESGTFGATNPRNSLRCFRATHAVQPPEPVVGQYFPSHPFALNSRFNELPTQQSNRDAVRSAASEKCRQTRADFDERNIRYHNLIREILKDFPNVTLFDPTLLFCDAEWCYGTKDGIKLYRDVDHLSEFGSAYVANSLSKIVIDSLNKPEKY